jgi:SAM-dependent methyltransferase
MTQAVVDTDNAEFWDELCGSNLARELGITDASAESLARYDAAYFEMYPYLLDYFPREQVEGKKLLDVGLGYGTLGEALARLGADYHGLDIAPGPVAMLRERLARVPGARPEQVQQGSVLELPFEDATFDHCVSIGCLHHTGDLARAISEMRRVLRPGGRFVMMVYNRRSGRLALVRPALALRGRLRPGAPSAEETLRGFYDGRPDGEGPPHTDFVTLAELRGLLVGFHDVHIDRRGIDRVPLGVTAISRETMLRTRLDRLIGLDLYAVARR